MTFRAKKNFVLFTRFFLLFLLILGFLYYFFFIYSVEESKYLKNITELYSSFTELISLFNEEKSMQFASSTEFIPSSPLAISAVPFKMESVKLAIMF